MRRKITNVLLATAVIAMMAGCGSKCCKTAESTAADSLVYEGMVPAADCAGIRYRIAMDARKKNFTMKEDYMESDTKVKDSFNEKGTVEPYSKNGKEGIKLSTGNNGSELYFISVGDSTLRMVNDDLEESATASNYDLKLKK